MPNVSESIRVTPKQVQKDIESYHAFGSMTDYRANNTAHSREAADVAYETLRSAEQHAVTSQAAANAAADALTAARRDFHGIVLGIKNEAVTRSYRRRCWLTWRTGVEKKPSSSQQVILRGLPIGHCLPGRNP